MTGDDPKGPFIARPGRADRWIRSADRPKPDGLHSARLTVDVTPALRRRLKLAALRRGQTLADMLRELLAREFPPSEGDLP